MKEVLTFVFVAIARSPRELVMNTTPPLPRSRFSNTINRRDSLNSPTNEESESSANENNVTQSGRHLTSPDRDMSSVALDRRSVPSNREARVFCRSFCCCFSRCTNVCTMSDQCGKVLGILGITGLVLGAVYVLGSGGGGGVTHVIGFKNDEFVL